MYRLLKLESDDQWRSLHSIRREVLFDTGVMPFVYDENRPEDREAANTPYLLELDGKHIGVIRLDVTGSVCIVRMVAIISERQRNGHGRVLDRLVEKLAASKGITELRVNAYRGAIGFYEKLGWTAKVWDPDELARLTPGDQQMIKAINQSTLRLPHDR